jgi:hypothetical protein
MAVEQPLSGAGVEPDIGEDLRLHAPRPPVMRLSRKALMTLGVVGSTAVAGAVAFALSQPATGKGGNEGDVPSSSRLRRVGAETLGRRAHTWSTATR